MISQPLLPIKSSSARVEVGSASASATSSRADLKEKAGAIAFLDRFVGAERLQKVGFRLWDGTLWPDNRCRAATIAFPQPRKIWSTFGPGTELAAAEAFVRGEFEIEGDTEAACELADVIRERKGTREWGNGVRWLRTLIRGITFVTGTDRIRSFRYLGTRHSLRKDCRAIAFHYDLSNDFFQLWLDRRMVYSCAYFNSSSVSLEAAQEAKLDLICRKLRLKPGQRLLDIGCGWGALAVFAAQRYGVQVVGVTLSAAQAERAVTQVTGAGLQDSVRIELKDYRTLAREGTFDAIASIGMSEHVGRKHLADYFQTAANLLRPGGVFLNHAIGEGARPKRRRGGSFIDKYVFPDSDVPQISIVLRAAESAGFEVRDVENLREHYRLTLREWLRRLESAHDVSASLVGESVHRIWRLYLAGSAHAFATGQIGVYQALLSKPDQSGQSSLPLTRADWYQS